MTEKGRRNRGLFGTLALALLALGAAALLPASAAAGPDPAKVMGPNECGECHKVSVQVWQGTHHFSTFREMPRRKEAREISKAMGLKRIKAGGLCLDCHFTTQDAGGKVDAIAGISCESCHGPSKDWLKRHSTYSGKKKETESAEEAKQRWVDSEAAGMIRPYNTYAWVKNCYDCHTVPQEKLVNEGGHPAGSAFEVVSWSQGEVRHNVWTSAGKENTKATPARKRMMFLVGSAVELETSLRAVGKATTKAKYAVAMAKRAQAARKRMEAIAAAVSAPEIDEIVAAAKAAKLRLNNEAELTAAADKVADAAMRLSASYDGSTFAAVDSMIPGEDKYKGTPAR